MIAKRTSKSVHRSIKSLLPAADTGITGIEQEAVSLKALNLPPEFDDERPKYQQRLREAEEGTQILLYTGTGEQLVLTLDDVGELVIERTVTIHGNGNETFKLPIAEESEGTIRFFHLAPALSHLTSDDCDAVYIVDGLDRSMHPVLTVELVRRFLQSISPTDGKAEVTGRRQLIFSTHETELLDEHLFRRDEIWLMTKNAGNSELIRVSDFHTDGVRAGSLLRNLYLNGQLGAIPRV